VAVLALDKQRRLCLVAAHRSCATRIAAAQLSARDDVGSDDQWQAGTSSSRAGTVTRWSIVRTAPVVLEAASESSARAGDRPRRMIVQGAIGGLMALALGAALLVARLPDDDAGGVPAVLSATGVPSSAAMAAADSSSSPATPRPTVPATLGTLLGGSAPAPASAWSAPAASAPLPRAHRVRAGDTLYAIAVSYGTTVEALQALNDLGASTTIKIGQELRLR
jgi:LysM repeat protein